MARAFIASLDLRNIRKDLSVYLRAAGAICIEEEMGDGESGTTFTRPDGKHVTTVNSRESEERRRFTVCHEIAHIMLKLPSSHEGVPTWSFAKRHPNEIACDWFAAELLMPYKQWLESVPKGEPSFEVIERMAAEFRCSYPATASRYAALATAPCAFVTMEHGMVRYAARSTALRRVRAWISPRTPIPQGSVAHGLRSAGLSGHASGEIAHDVWFENWEPGLDMNEMSRHYRSTDTTTSLLWFEAEELPEREFDRFGRQMREDEGLEELTGELPWPGKSRRK